MSHYVSSAKHGVLQLVEENDNKPRISGKQLIDTSNIFENVEKTEKVNPASL